MIDVNSNLQLHLKLNEKIASGDGFEIHDYSGHEKHAAVTGNPTVVADEYLGSCLLFKDGDSLLVEGLEGFDQPGPYTVGIWVKSAALGTSFLSKSRDAGFRWQLGAGETWTWTNEPSSSLSVGSANLEPRKPVNDDHWHHLAVTADKNGKLTAYQDGAYAGSCQGGQAQDFGSTGKLWIGTQEFSSETNFTGKMAHVRIYARCLASDEIQECVYADKTALAAFRTSHPFEFNLVNKETMDPVLYITSDNKETARTANIKNTQTLVLEVTNTSDTDFTFGNAGSLEADKDHYHFQLQFRPNTLSNAAIRLLRQENGILKAQAWAQGWDIRYDPNMDDLVDWISMLWIGLNDGIKRISSYMTQHTEEVAYHAMLEKQLTDADTRMKKMGGEFADLEMPTKSTVRFELSGLSAGAAGGTRATRVYLFYQNLEQSTGGSTIKILPGSRSQTLEIVNRLGKERIPLHVGFIRSNGILNDGTPSELVLRITNLTNKLLSLYTGDDPECKPKFRLSFDYQDPSQVSNDESGQWERHWAIGTTEVALSINITPTEDDRERWTVSGVQDSAAPRPFWLIQPTDSNIAFNEAETVEFVISSIMTTAPTGITNLYVEYKNIPGYWDGQFVLPIEKGALVQRPRALSVAGVHPDGKPTLSFDGENDSIEAAGISIPQQGTLEAWIYLDDAEYPEGWRGIAAFDYNNNLILGLSNGTLCLRYSVGPGAGYADIVVNEGTPHGQWVHVAGTWSQSGWTRLYVNGVEKSAYDCLFQAGDTDNILRIGYFGNNFKGRIARVSFWSIDRTGEDIRADADMARALNGSENGLIAYWPLDKADTATDLAGKYHGDIRGNPQLITVKDYDENFRNIGIGTDKPKAKLHVNVIKENGVTENQEPAAVFEGGKVGIGTDQPLHDLDVAGDANVSGDIFAKHVYADTMEVKGLTANGSVSAGSLQVNGAITGALDGVNINDKSITLDKLVEAVQQALCPVGTILPFAGDTAPSGWLMCGFGGLDPAKYPALFSVIKYRFGGFTQNNIHYFMLPDLRGRFLRGRDNGANRDLDRDRRPANFAEGATGDNVGSVQEDDYKKHSHSYERAFGTTESEYEEDAGGMFFSGTTWQITSDSPTSMGTETRPKNMYVNYIIKY